MSSSSTSSSSGSLAASLLFLAIGFVFYMLPTIVAMVRGRPNTGPIGVVNFFLGWTLVGWVVALAWACMADSNRERIS